MLFRAAEADMGEEVSNGIGRLGLIDFTSHILLRRNHHWLRNKYVRTFTFQPSLAPIFIEFRENWHKTTH